MPNVPSNPTLLAAQTKKKNPYKCTACGRTFTVQKGNFYRCSNSRFFKANDGFFHMCTECTKEWYNMLKNSVASEKDALRLFCQAFDVYYNDQVAQYSIDSGKLPCSIYLTKIGIAGNGKKNFSNTLAEIDDLFAMEQRTLVDTRCDELNETIQKQEEIIEELQSKLDSIISEEKEIKELGDNVVQFWGTGYSPAEYKLLEEEYSSWSLIAGAGNDLDKRSEAYLVQICKILIDIKRARDDRDYTAISGLTKLYTNTLKEWGLDSDLDDNGIQNNGLGVLIQNWEQHDPVPEDENKSVIRKYINTFFVGHLAHILKLDNPYAHDYEEEMSHYTVTPPDTNEDISVVLDSDFDMDGD